MQVLKEEFISLANLSFIIIISGDFTGTGNVFELKDLGNFE